MTGRAVRFRAVTWNIHGAVGAGGKLDDQRVLAAIERLQPDVLALQEIDGRSRLGRRPYAFERYAERLGPHVAEARTVPGSGGRCFGHILWSRWPIRAARAHTLPGPNLERRMAIAADLAPPDAPGLHVVAVHMGLLPPARRRQARWLAEHVAGRAESVLVMGDTNEWARRGPVDRALRAHLPAVASLPSWPARRPFVAMDRAYGGGGLRLCEAHVDAESWRASDHRPLVVDWTLDRAAP